MEELKEDMDTNGLTASSLGYIKNISIKRKIAHWFGMSENDPCYVKQRIKESRLLYSKCIAVAQDVVAKGGTYQ